MAQFCMKCGATLPETGTGFCPSCGTHIDTPAATSQPVAAAPAPVPPPVQAQPVGAYPAVPPKGSGGGVLKVVLIVIAVVVVLGVAGVGIAGYLGYRALHAAGSAISVGSSAQVADSDLGVPVYPGAAAKPGAAARVKLGNSLMVTAAYTTSDPVNSVEDFYRAKVGGQAIESKNVRGTSFESTTTNGAQKDSLVVTITPDASGNGTQIVILHTSSSTSSS